VAPHDRINNRQVPLMIPLSRRITRSMSAIVVLAWAGTMALVVYRAYVQASSNLATDLGRYGSAAQWRGIYYRGEKIGFTVSQVVPRDDGFELQEDGRLQMTLFGAASAARLRTTARVDRAFAVRTFEFSLDPGTGATEVRGALRDDDAAGRVRLTLTITTPSGSRTEERVLDEAPVLTLNLARRLANGGLVPGARYDWTMFDPATLRNAPMRVGIGKREVVRAGGRPVPAFRIDVSFAGLHTTSWVTDTGEVVREESPMGLIVVRESPEQAQSLAVPGRVGLDLIEAAAVRPAMLQRPIDEPRNVRRLRLRLEGADLTSPDVEGDGQHVDGDVVEIRDPRMLQSTPRDAGVRQFLDPEPLIESDDPEIRAEAERAVRGATGTRARAEALTRHVNAILKKKPTVSLPSAREVLRTRVGDCNEHTALYVAMARAIGIPSRIAVGLVYLHGAFYYHAWPEVYLDDGPARGLWLPVDPTLNEFPANAMHLRLARGGLDRQADIIPLVGRLKITVLDLEMSPGSTPILVGRAATDPRPLSIELPRRESAADCWSSPRAARP